MNVFRGLGVAILSLSLSRLRLLDMLKGPCSLPTRSLAPPSLVRRETRVLAGSPRLTSRRLPYLVLEHPVQGLVRRLDLVPSGTEDGTVRPELRGDY